MARIRFARETVVLLAKEYPVRFTLWVVACDAAATGGAYWLTSELHKGRGLIVAAAVLTGILLALTILFIWALIVAPRRDLQIRVKNLEDEAAKFEERMDMFIEEKYGNPLQFTPIYQQLRTDLREACRIVQRAKDTGKLWSRTAVPDDDIWKKNKDSLGTHFWADQELFGILDEAFGHIDRLGRQTTMRFGTSGRVVKESDDLVEAIESMRRAEAALDGVIAHGSSIQAPVSPDQLDMDTGPGG